MEKECFIYNGIAKFFEPLKIGITHNMRYSKEMARCIAYWNQIHLEINNSQPIAPTTLKHRFLSIFDWVGDEACATPEFGCSRNYHENIILENVVDAYQYCSRLRDWPKLIFNSFNDLLFGDFDLCRPITIITFKFSLDECLNVLRRYIIVQTIETSRWNCKFLWDQRKWKNELLLESVGRVDGKRSLVDLSQVVHESIVISSYKMPLHTKKGLSNTHVMIKASIVDVLINLRLTAP